MKYLNFLLFLVIIALFISGCSSRKDNNSSPTGEPEPSIGASPSTNSPTDIPTRLPSLTTTPAPTEPSITGSITPSSEYGQAALQLLNQMSLEEKVGQMFFVRYNRETALDDLEKYHLGGFILFSDAFSDQTRSGIKDILAGYQSSADIPLLIGVDEEGGTVNRVSKYSAFRKTPFKSPQELYQLGGFELIVKDTIEKATLLKSLGINVNLAPVCDVSTDPKDFIYKRAFGQDARKTSEYVQTVVSTMDSQDIGSTLKHFPGYGNNVDTHTGIAIDERKEEEFYGSDFLPFEAGIKAGAGSILVSHNIVKAFDEKYPASLSPKVHTILRNDLKFNGVIMTDDLSMDAIKEYTNNEDAAVLAVSAGNDLLIASDYGVQIPAVIAAAEDGTLPIESIDAAVLRILEWKFTLGLISR